MKIELTPNYENIIKTLKTDVLGRNIVLKRFVKALYLMKEQNIISLNGEWGAGKTFFVEQAIEIIKSLSLINYEINPEIKNFIDSFREEDMRDIETGGKLFPIYFNAWEYDSNEDPLLTLIFSIISQNPDVSDIENKRESIKQKILRIISNFKIGASYQDEIGRSIGIELQYDRREKEPLTKDVYSVEEVKKTFNELLKDIMTEKANKIVVFIDELDRCNPIFAVKLLERVKHFFDDKRFIFVFSTNLIELQHTIKKYYGEGIDGYSYLDKFFDLQFSLRNINIEKYIDSMQVIDVGSGYFIDVCAKEMCLLFNFSLRKCNRYMELISLVYESIRKENRDILATCILFPILLAIKINNINIYEKIVSGSGENELKEIILNSRELIGTMNYFFETQEKEDELTFDFSNLYNYIFINKKEVGVGSIKIGNKNIEYAHCRKVLMDLLTFLMDFIRF